MHALIVITITPGPFSESTGNLLKHFYISNKIVMVKYSLNSKYGLIQYLNKCTILQIKALKRWAISCKHNSNTFWKGNLSNNNEKLSDDPALYEKQNISVNTDNHCIGIFCFSDKSGHFTENQPGQNNVRRSLSMLILLPLSGTLQRQTDLAKSEYVTSERLSTNGLDFLEYLPKAVQQNR